MFLERLKLINFKNFETKTLNFSPRFNLICGPNGVGKTNILDGIHYLSFCKAHSPSRSQSGVRIGSDFFALEGSFRMFPGGEYEKIDQFFFTLQKGKPLVKCNGKSYKRLIDHIGKIPLVILAPQDQNIIFGGGEVRRRWFNMVISQVNTKYLECLSDYNRTLLQRNTALKRGLRDQVLYQGYDKQLAQYSKVIYQARKDFTMYLREQVNKYLKMITTVDEEIDLGYQTQMNSPEVLGHLLKDAFQKDLYLQRTTCGIHRDDLIFKVRGSHIKTYLSQGQQRSFLIALRISEYNYIASHSSKKPMLLLDDLFDKLDMKRTEALFTILIEGDFGQIFITDTESKRFHTVMESKTLDCKIFGL